VTSCRLRAPQSNKHVQCGDLSYTGFDLDIPPTMLSATQQVINTVELLDAIFEKLPLDQLLRARHVSRLWREVINNSRTVKRIKDKPYIGVRIHVPEQGIAWDNHMIRLDADLTLYATEPLTIGRYARSLEFHAQLAEECREIDTPPPDQEKPLLIMVGPHKVSKAAPASFKMDRQDQWETLLPGKSHRVAWPFHEGWRCCLPDPSRQGEMTFEPGYSLYNSYSGTKKSLLQKLDDCEKLDKYRLLGPIALVAEDVVCCALDSESQRQGFIEWMRLSKMLESSFEMERESPGQAAAEVGLRSCSYHTGAPSAFSSPDAVKNLSSFALSCTGLCDSDLSRPVYFSESNRVGTPISSSSSNSSSLEVLSWLLRLSVAGSSFFSSFSEGICVGANLLLILIDLPYL